MTPALSGILFGFAGAAMLAAPQDDEGRQKALQAPFDVMEKSVRERDEAFKARWHPEGFEKNFVGGRGLDGKAVFGQGSRKKWFLKPDLAQAKILQEGAADIVPCLVWGWEKEKAVDKVNILLIRGKDGHLVLGGGGKREQVDALASRRLKKEPLGAPKEKE